MTQEISGEQLPPDSDVDVDDSQSDGEWSVKDLLTMNFVVSSRVYDVLITLLMDTDVEKGEHLLGLHAEGALLMPAPGFNGAFVTTEVNRETTTTT